MAFPPLMPLEAFCDRCQLLLTALLRDDYMIFTHGVEDWIMRYTRLDPCYRHHKSLIRLQHASDAGYPICIQIYATIKSGLSLFRSQTASFWIVFKPDSENLTVFFVDDGGAYGNVVDFKILTFAYQGNKNSVFLDLDLLQVSQASMTAKIDDELRRNHAPIDPTVAPMPEMFIGIRKKQWDLPVSAKNSLPTLAYPLSQRTDDDVVIKLAQDWLTTCVRDHRSTCSHAPDYTPPRLLDLRGPSVKLILR